MTTILPKAFDSGEPGVWLQLCLTGSVVRDLTLCNLGTCVPPPDLHRKLGRGVVFCENFLPVKDFFE